MASLTKKTPKPISDRISMFESPSGSPNAAFKSSPSPTNKINLTKTFSKTNFGALKSQFDSGGGRSNSPQPSNKVEETKPVVSAPSSSQSQQSSAASSLAPTPSTTPTPPPQNASTNSKTGDGSSSQRERRKLPATPKSSSDLNPSSQGGI